MSDELRIYATDAGPTCGACVIETGRRGQATPYDFPGWQGGLCALCQHVMPPDGSPEGRTRPTAMADIGPVTLEEARYAVRHGRGTVLANDFQRVVIRYAGEKHVFDWPHPLPFDAPGRRVIECCGFRHPGDIYLVMVLCEIGHRSESGGFVVRELATWYYNLECGGFNEGHYFEPDEDAEARRDFEERCKRYY